MGSKHSSTNKRNMSTTRETMLKNNSFGHIPREYFGLLMNFSADPPLSLSHTHTHIHTQVAYIYIYIYIY